MNSYIIELASEKDLVDILDIYNQAIEAKDNAILKTINYDTFKDEFSKRDLQEYPIFVYKENEEIIGWISLSPYRANRIAYKKLKEVSFYVDYNHLGKGIGSILLSFIIQNKSKHNYDSLIAILISGNTKSVKLLERFNFKEWGKFPSVLDMNPGTESVLIYGLNFK
jgi:phosphinothricin acetyltransferase